MSPYVFVEYSRDESSRLRVFSFHRPFRVSNSPYPTRETDSINTVRLAFRPHASSSYRLLALTQKIHDEAVTRQWSMTPKRAAAPMVTAVPTSTGLSPLQKSGVFLALRMTSSKVSSPTSRVTPSVSLSVVLVRAAPEDDDDEEDEKEEVDDASSPPAAPLSTSSLNR